MATCRLVRLLQNFAAIGILLAASSAYATPPSLTVEIVNDTGNQSDANVYTLLSGTTVQGVSSPMSYVDLGTAVNGQPYTGIPLSSLSTNGTVVSPLSGATRPIYYFTLNAVTSARLFFSYGQPVTFTGKTAPNMTANYLYDKFEFDYSTPPTVNTNLTSLDFLAIPMRLEAIGADGTVLDSRAFYGSFSSLVSTLSKLFPASQRSIALPKSASGSVLRLMSPNTLASLGSSGSPAPYPSFSSYLSSLCKSKYAFTTSGTQGVGQNINTVDPGNPLKPTIPQYQATYSYTGRVTCSSKGDYTITLRGGMSDWREGSSLTPVSVPPAPVPDASTIVINLPKSLLDFRIYAAPLSYGVFDVPGFANIGTNDTDKQTYFNWVLSNSVHSWVVGNVLSGLAYGYVGGKFSNSTANWFSPLSTAAPFATARRTPDGFYNPFAAEVYNTSDSYGFALSDRGYNGTNPLLSFSAGVPAKLRVTLLPKSQLNTPANVHAQMATSAKTGPFITVSWDKVAGASAYKVSAYPPSRAGTIATKTPQAKVTGLTSGMPYQLSIRAKKGRIESLPMTLWSFSGSTAFSPAPGSFPFQFGLAWTPADASKYIVKVAGQTVTYDATNHQWSQVTLTANPGDNYYPIIVALKGGKHSLVYANVFKLSAGTQSFLQFLAPPTMPGDTNMTVAYAGGRLEEYPNTGPLTGLVVTTSAQPTTQKVYGTITFPKKK